MTTPMLDVADHPLVIATTRVATDLLAPAAEQVDGLALLPSAHLDALAEIGLMGLYGPAADGGPAAPPPVVRRCQQLVAGACGATFFTWVQHHSPLRLVVGAPDGEARRRWLQPLCTGEARAGVAFAYLRRPGPPAVRACRAGGGWILEGTAPWVTGWGLVDVILVVAGCDDGRKLLCLVSVDAPGLLPEPLELMVFQSTGTVRLALDQVAVSADQVVDIWCDERWRQVDRLAAARPVAAPFGIAETCIQGLRGADRPGGSLAGTAAAALASELDRCQRRTDELVDHPPPSSEPELTGWLEALTTARDWSIDLANRAAQAWVAAAGGQAMSRSHPAQRLVREATFYLIQAQTGQLRRAELARLARPGDPRNGHDLTRA